MEGILHERQLVRHAVEPFEIALVLGEEKVLRPFTAQPIFPERVMARLDYRKCRGMITTDAQIRAATIPAPTPGITQPERRQEMKGGWLGPAISHRCTDEKITRRRLRVFDGDVEKALVAQHIGVPELEFRLRPRALGIPPHQVLVGKRRLRIAIRHSHVGVGRRVVFEEENFLYILAMVSLRTRQAKEPLLEDGVASIPKCEGETEPLLEVANPADPIFAPAVGTRARMVVREIIPGVTVRAVILADRAPLPLA